MEDEDAIDASITVRTFGKLSLVRARGDTEIRIR